MALVVFEVYKVAPCGSMRLHADPCISRLKLKGLHMAPVVFEVYTGAPCSSCIICRYWQLSGIYLDKSNKLFDIYSLYRVGQKFPDKLN